MAAPVVAHELAERAGVTGGSFEYWTLNPAGASVLDPNRSAALYSAKITHGTDDPRDHANPPTATLVLYRAPGTPGAAMTLPQLGQRLQFRAATNLTTWAGAGAAEKLTRFTGEVTDVQIDPVRHLVTVTAAGFRARANRVNLNVETWRRERDGARVARTLDACGLPAVAAGTIDPGTVPLLPPDGPTRRASEILNDTATSSLGRIVERRTGAIDWHDSAHRAGATSRLTLTPDNLLNDFEWTQRAGDLTNRVTVRYGDRQETTIDATAGGDAWEDQIATSLPAHAQAALVGAITAGRYRTPRWRLPAVELDLVRTLPPALLQPVLALQAGDLITLDNLPAGGPYTTRQVFIEGIQEQLTARAWRLTLHVSDIEIGAAPLRWIDLDTPRPWTALNPTRDWLGVAAITNPTDL